MMNKIGCFAVILCFAMLCVKPGAAVDSMVSKCAAVITKVTMCLPFATAKEAVPTSKCCGAVTDMRNSDPACMCYVIQQVHNASNPQVKSLGLQESRLLQLPSACRVANASVSECPRLLHLDPNSPDAAIFTNNSTSAASTTPVSTPGTASPTTASPNQGFWIKPQLSGSVIVAIAIFITAFPSGFLSS